MSDEPFLIRSKWGTNRYVYNHRNPAGLALIIITPLIVIAGLWAMRESSEWSEGELRSAVRQAATALSERPHYGSEELGWEGIIRDAVSETGEGPDYGGVHADRDGSDYTVSGDGTNAKFCMRVTATPKGEQVLPGHGEYVMSVLVDDGPC
ncbi:hypothetical protein [Streptomyces sp. NPDC000410]|uniref:hypothetical protein n=1 Tax=Streptomyces sp. NPDC000410 TaxID=3154254 RepID=UPI0033295A2F